MSDPASTPPKPKPGSLRDRIAAFEKGASSAAPAPGAAPPPRPKPAGFASWKPKVPSPPSSPSAAGDKDHASSASKAGTMSASDAKESIVKGGSLKDRMAALQGKGGFGAPPPPVAPKPTVEKPKWKPPPVVHAPVEDKEEDGEEARAHEPTVSPPTVVRSPPEGETPKAEEEEEKDTAPDGEGEQPAEADPEEEERQRRAAIAARMARLGGARLGMSPPVYGSKPAAKKPSLPKEEAKPESVKVETPKDEEVKPAETIATLGAASITEGAIVTSPPAEEMTSPEAPSSNQVSTDRPTDYFPQRKSSESASLLSVDADSQPSKSPSSMPVPAVPRRAAPPRRRTPKSPAPPSAEEVPETTKETAPQVDEGASPAALDVAPEEEKEKSAELETDAPKEEDKPVESSEHASPAEVDVPEGAGTAKGVPTHNEVVHEKKPDVEHEKEAKSEVLHEASPVALPEHEPGVVNEHNESSDEVSVEPEAKAHGESPAYPEPVAEEEPAVAPVEQSAPEVTEETEEDSRRKRIAERLAKMGGINPLGAPPRAPQRKPSASSEDVQSPASPTMPQRSPSIKRDSTGFPNQPQRRESLRKSSVDSSHGVASPEQETTLSSAPEQVSEETLVQVVEETVAQVAEETTEEEDDIARRKRVAEKLAKMGGVNPFGAPPFAPPKRKPSASSEDVQSPPAPAPKPAPAKRDSIGSVHSPQAKEPLRRPSAGASMVHHEEATVDAIEPASLTSEPQDDTYFEKSFDHGRVTAVPESENENETYDSEEADEGRSDNESNESEESVYEYANDEADSQHHGKTEEAETPILPSSSAAAHLSSPPGRPAPQPRRIVPQAPEDDDDDEEEDDDEEMNELVSERLATSTLFVPPPRTRGTAEDEDSYASQLGDEDSTDNDAIPIPHRMSMQVPSGGADSDAEYHPTSGHAARPRRSIPQPPASDGEEDSDYAVALPTRPRRSPGTPANDDIPLIVRPPGSPDTLQKRTSIVRPPPVHRALPPAPELHSAASLERLSPSMPTTSQEILDEEEGDPIDPAFHSPSRRASTINLPSHSPQDIPAEVTPPQATSEEPDQAHRRTIAERMARLGGIKFGASPIPTSISRRPTPQEEGDAAEESHIPSADEPAEVDEEEEERARKARIASKLAGMGGMRIGMLPGAMPPHRSYAMKEEPTLSPLSHPSTSPPSHSSTPPLQRTVSSPQRAVPPARPPPPPQAQEEDSEQGSATASEDGVKVDAEESEIEEVSYEDAQEPIEEVPPPVPTRIARHASSTSSTHTRESTDTSRSPHPVSPTRPPVPSAYPGRRTSVGTPKSPTRRTSGDSTFNIPHRQPLVHKPQSEYVMVDEPESFESEAPPPPPARPANRAPPSRAPPPPAASQEDSISSQWELPSIPSSSLEFGSGGDLSLSWSEAGEPDEQASTPPPPPPAKPAARKQSATSPVDLHLSADDLMSVWGRVGVQICEVATALFEKSKKGLIGDGTYLGFIEAVLREVPNAAPMAPPAFGYVVYAQSGSAVQKRASEIMPGDVVELHDAKLKGHKGLQTYHQTVGAGEPLLGIVGEFEPKKSKIRVFQANQHVGQQTVESVSYRLEDLKNGTVKVYRVLEA